MFSASIYIKKHTTLHHIKYLGSQVQTKKRKEKKKGTDFTFRKKGSKKQLIDIKINLTFCTVQSQNWKKPLQSVHMAWLFLAQKLEENVFKKSSQKPLNL